MFSRDLLCTAPPRAAVHGGPRSAGCFSVARVQCLPSPAMPRPVFAQARVALNRLAALLKRAASLEIQAELSREAAVRAELSGLVHRAGRVRAACG